VGHLKFHLSFHNQSLKISHTTILDKTIKDPATFEKAGTLDLLINARIQSSPEALRNILFDALDQLKSKKGVTIHEKFLSYFQPGFPNPTHRLR